MQDPEFNSSEPLGYFITWTAYGTWLPGDERGWQKKHDGERQLPNELFRQMAAAAMTETAFHLTRADREIVDATVRRHCEIRQWQLHTVNPRSNHVHVVVSAPGYKPEVVREQLKAWCTRKLKVHAPDREKFWAERGSRRYLNTQEDLDAAILYAQEGQDRESFEN